MRDCYFETKNIHKDIYLNNLCQTNVLFQIVKPVFGKICCSQYLYICSRHTNFHNVQLSSVVECWTANLEIPGSNPDANFLVKFQLKKFRFQIWKVVFRIRSVNHKNIRMMTHGVEFQSYKTMLPPPIAYWSLWICFYWKPNLVFLGSNQHWLSYYSPQEDMIIIQFQMLINHLFQNWELNKDLNYVGPGVYSAGTGYTYSVREKIV